MDGHCSGDRCAPLQRQQDTKAVGCTNSQQAKESIGDDKCEYLPSPLLSGWR